ncbi:hypothetical protein CEXT_780831 [Caerostris extrusa]|uniref:Uncharacterized protein n=1 Tax=Caerostris extrusa TaxID=172846 RepID=A0AAV4XET8_CAEEX|nr:hypothetical protein CEXT_780831 [Caerostris extrusa]
MELLNVLTNVVGTAYIIFALIFSPFQNSEPEAAELSTEQGPICDDVGKCRAFCETIPAFRKLKGVCVGTKCACIM